MAPDRLVGGHADDPIGAEGEGEAVAGTLQEVLEDEPRRAQLAIDVRGRLQRQQADVRVRVGQHRVTLIAQLAQMLGRHRHVLVRRKLAGRAAVDVAAEEVAHLIRRRELEDLRRDEEDRLDAARVEDRLRGLEARQEPVIERRCQAATADRGPLGTGVEPHELAGIEHGALRAQLVDQPREVLLVARTDVVRERDPHVVGRRKPVRESGRADASQDVSRPHHLLLSHGSSVARVGCRFAAAAVLSARPREPAEGQIRARCATRTGVPCRSPAQPAEGLADCMSSMRCAASRRSASSCSTPSSRSR